MTFPAPRTGERSHEVRKPDGLVLAFKRAGAIAFLLLCFPTLVQAQSVQDYIDHYAAAYGVDPALMLKIAICESQLGTDPNTNAPSNPHRGVFQWEKGSWEEVAPQIGVGGDFGEAYSAASSTAVAAYTVAIGGAWRWAACL